MSEPVAFMTKPSNIKNVLTGISFVMMRFGLALSVALTTFGWPEYFPMFNCQVNFLSGRYLLSEFRIGSVALLSFHLFPAGIFTNVVDSFLSILRVKDFVEVFPLIPLRTFLAMMGAVLKAAQVKVIYRFFEIATRAEKGFNGFQQGVLLNRALSYDSCIHASGCRSFYFNMVSLNA